MRQNKKDFLRGLALALLLGFACIQAGTQTAQAQAKEVKAKFSASKVKVGERIYVTAKTEDVKFVSSDEDIAYISSDGVITGKREGKVTIKVKRAGYETKKKTIYVKAAAKKPATLPVALDEVKLVSPVLEADEEGNMTYSFQVKNTSQTGTIKKIVYYYKIQTVTESSSVQEESIEASGDAQDAALEESSAAAAEDTAEPLDGMETKEDAGDADPTGDAENADDSAAEEIPSVQTKQKKVSLTVKNIKPGAVSKTVQCEGDYSGDLSNMVLYKVKLYTGPAIYVYQAQEDTETLKWGVSDHKAPVFSGWIEKDSFCGSDAFCVYYSDRKGTYHFKKYVTVKDNKDKNVKITVDTSALNWEKTGLYKIRFQAVDQAGNEATTWAKVQVIVPGTPEDAADSILKSITKTSWSNTAKAKAIYKYIGKHCSYISETSHGNWRTAALRGIQYQTGDCYTYYSMARLLLTRAGIPNVMVSRYPVLSAHAHHYWNLAYVQGGWYHFDTTPRRRKGYFCLVTDAQLNAYSSGNTFSFRKAAYPERATKKIS